MIRKWKHGKNDPDGLDPDTVNQRFAELTSTSLSDLNTFVPGPRDYELSEPEIEPYAPEPVFDKVSKKQAWGWGLIVGAILILIGARWLNDLGQYMAIAMVVVLAVGGLYLLVWNREAKRPAQFEDDDNGAQV